MVLSYNITWKKPEFIIGDKPIGESFAPNVPVPLLQNNNPVKNLGVVVDSYNHLRDLGQIRKFFIVLILQYFWQMLWAVVIWTTVTLYGGSRSDIAKLQSSECSLLYCFQT